MKGEYATLPVAMSLRLCRVTVCDLEGVKHSVEVTASTLYEAVALGLVAIREQDWAGEIAEGMNTVDVSVTTVPVMYPSGGPRRYRLAMATDFLRIVGRLLKG